MKLTGGPNRYLLEQFTPVRNNAPYSQHLMDPSPKLITYLVIKQAFVNRKKIEIIPYIILDHHGLKLDSNKKRNNRQPTNSWKLNNFLLSDHWDRKK